MNASSPGLAHGWGCVMDEHRQSDRGRHERVVRACLEDALEPGATPATRAGVLRAGIHAVWLRSHPVMGDVTLAAIFQRVVDTGCKTFPSLARIDLRMRETRTMAWEPVDPAIAEEVTDGLGFILVELLTVLGRLTGNALTPAVHAELRRVRAASSFVPGEDTHETYSGGDDR